MKKEKVFYDSMYEYAKDGDFTHFTVSKLKNKEYAVDSADLFDQPDEITTKGESEYRDGKEYIDVNMGEDDQESYLLRSAIGQLVWFIYNYGACINGPFESRLDAQKWIEQQ